MRRTAWVVGFGVGCAAPPADEGFTCARASTASCVEVAADDPQGLLDVVNGSIDDTTVVLGEGRFLLDNQVTLRANGVALVGQGVGRTVLDFSEQASQGNGVDVVGDDFVIQDLTITDSTKDGLRIEGSRRVVIRRVEATWSGGPQTTNGAYGLYPVKSEDVLLEDSIASNASDAGIYVGQVVRAVVRNNTAERNVAGIEIENTQHADVYGNTAVHNTAGLVAFDLSGNPVVGRDIRIHDNVIQDNDQFNFAPGGTVAQVPAGTGTFVLASRRVEITGNTYARNGTVDVAVLSGLAIEPELSKWGLDPAVVRGEIDDLDLPREGGLVFNHETSDVWVHDNAHAESGANVDLGNTDLDLRPLGFLIAALYGDEPVDTVLYDAIGESAYDATDPSGNSNDHRICVGASAGVSFASLDMETLVARFEALDLPQLSDVYRPPPPFAPFGCEGPEDPIDVGVLAPPSSEPLTGDAG